MAHSIDASMVVSNFFDYFTKDNLTADGNSFTAAEGKDTPRKILKNLCARLQEKELILPFLNTIFNFFGKKATDINQEINDLQTKRKSHDYLASMLNDSDNLTVTDFTTSFSPLDTNTGVTSFVFSHGKNELNPFTVQMYHSVNPGDNTISEINLDIRAGRRQEGSDLSGDVADESELEKALSDLWNREYRLTT